MATQWAGLVPNEAFWGVNFQLRKTTADLANIENAIGSGGLDPRILREFREAVDLRPQSCVGGSGVAGAPTAKARSTDRAPVAHC